mmetsp:Transcript_13828/g.29150  ORF Transcript_13828/g.29150 Transcript_13828/m.29150 type:complete len:213 (+) Transcript_13828:273-911(+)
MSPPSPCRRNLAEANRPQTISTTRQTNPYHHTGDDNQSEYSSFEVETIETLWTNEYNQHTDISYLYGGSSIKSSTTADWLELKQRHYIGKLKNISNKLMSPDAKERTVNLFIEKEVPGNSRFREILTGVRTALPSKPRSALFAKFDTIFGCHCMDSMLENIEGKVMLDDDEDESMFTSNTGSMESFVSGKSFKWSAEDAETKEDKDREISKY